MISRVAVLCVYDRGASMDLMKVFGCILALAALPFSALGAPHIGYAQSSNYYKKESRPTLYQPLNLLDGREITCWCSTSSDPLAETLVFGFKELARIDEVRIYTGNGFDDRTFQDFSRAKKIIVRTPNGARSMVLADHRGLQAFSIDPPLVAAQFRLEIVEEYPAEDPEMPVCLTDVIFYSEGKALNGAWLTRQLKYDKNQAALLGTWFSGAEGAPDRFLSFFFDGTYRFAFQPFDEAQKPKSFSGRYHASAGSLALEIPGKGRVKARTVRERQPQEPGKATRTLTLDGELPDDLKQPFRDYW